MNRTQSFQRAQNHLLKSAEVKCATADYCLEDIVTAAERIVDTFRIGNKLLLCGNGGSAADCQHMATEFTSRLTKEFVRPALPAIALTLDSSFLTGFANDYGFDDVFVRLVEAFGKPGDVLLGISTSGNSTNVIRAVQAARSRQLITIALMGNGGALRDLVDVAITVPNDSTQYIQEAHLAVEHIICDLVEQALYGHS